MAKYIAERKPLTEQEVYEYLSADVEDKVERWGENYIYTKWAKEWRDDQINRFRAGEVVRVASVEYTDYYGNGFGDYQDVLYSDGSVKTFCYGYSD